MTFKKVGAFFILTVGRKGRAQKDHKRLCKLLGMSVDYLCFERNLSAALYAKRDF